MNRNIIILGGRTGGPLIPLLAIIRELKFDTLIVAGIKNGFEQKIASERKYKFLSFPEAKLRIISYKNQSVQDIILNSIDALKSLFVLGFAILKAILVLQYYQPKAIISAGSFLNIPFVIGLRICKLLFRSKTKLIVHQQDPEPGLSNRFVTKDADLLTCTFEYTRQTNGFLNSRIIPNPFDFSSVSPSNINYLLEKTRVENPKLYDILTSNSIKPLLFIFGGGSGSEFINSWVQSNLQVLIKSFRIIHLSGHYQEELQQAKDLGDFLSLPVLTDLMPLVEKKSDLVLSRCGMGTVTELLNLQKPAFLVPLPNSHQEINAREVSNWFFILHQQEAMSWVETIKLEYPQWFCKVDYPVLEKNKNDLIQYYKEIQAFIDS